MLHLSVRNPAQDLRVDHAAGPIELGRGPQRGAVPRCRIDDATASRDHLQVEETAPGQVRLTNLSQRWPVTLADGSAVSPGDSRQVSLPVQLTVGQTLVGLAAAPPAAAVTLAPPADPPAPAPLAAEEFAAEGFLTIAQPVRRAAPLPRLSPAVGLGESPAPETLAQWMEAVLALQRSGGGPAESYEQAARALIDLIGLDVGLVLLHGDGGWRAVARAGRDEDDSRRPAGREFSQTVLGHVLAERRTFFQDLDQLKSQESLKSVDAVVASPVFGLRDEVVGALYGLRRSRGRLKGCKVRPLEAQLVQLLAAAVGANLARTAATRTRVQFEQFFSPELVRELERDPALLEGRGQEVTILMSDLRGFSALSERLGPRDTCRLVRDVMERLSERIVEHGGAIVSYLGDGILAMWNAPAAQPGHAVAACRAALAMQREVPALSAAWEALAGGPLAIGIGINSGPAQVGNTGSTRKFMYGPLGNTVNLASRVEGATKHLHVPILVTGSTRAQLGDAFATRRLCKVRVVGIAEPVDLYELHGETAPPDWLARRDAYETGLGLFERGQWLEAGLHLWALLQQTRDSGKHDHATLKLTNRCVACLAAPPEPFEPVLELSSK